MADEKRLTLTKDDVAEVVIEGVGLAYTIITQVDTDGSVLVTVVSAMDDTYVDQDNLMPTEEASNG